jgi:hypothetical protein
LSIGVSVSNIDFVRQGTRIDIDERDEPVLSDDGQQ